MFKITSILTKSNLEHKMNSRMIKLAIIAVSILLVGGLISTASFNRSIETSIVIERGPDRVWAAITEINQYVNWSPFIKSIEGELKIGEQLEVLIMPEGESGMNFTPEVLVADTNRELRWIGKLGVHGVFDGEHYFILEKLDDNRTRLHHGEEFSGLLAPVIWSLIEGSTLKGFTDHNQSLKMLVENKST
jgi:hypothetical protein